MREILSLLIMPFTIFLLLFLVGVFLVIRRRALGKWLLGVAGLWLLIISSRPLPVALIKNLEKEFSQLPDSVIESLPDTVNVLVLGAGHSDDPALSPNNQLSITVLGRLVEGVRIYKGLRGSGAKGQWGEGQESELNSGRNLKLVVSGAKGRLKTSQAEVLKETAVSLGVDSSDIGMLTRTVNTRNEAEEYVKNYRLDRQLILVSDAIHMRRAVKIFTDAGVEVIPAPANFIIKKSSAKSRWRWVPSAGNIELMETAIHEYAGMLWHRVGGR